VDEEHGQEPPLAGPTDRNGFTALRDCQCTQREELDHRTLPFVSGFTIATLTDTCGKPVAATFADE
jgi:hypothetical protein